MARIVAQEGEWILPSRVGILPSKPPLFHWLVATSAKFWGGVDEVRARHLSVLSGLVMLVVTALWGRRYLLGRGSGGGSPVLGTLLPALLLSCNYGFLRLAGDARVDALFAALVTLALFVCMAPIVSARDRRLAAESAAFEGLPISFWVLTGLAVLAKGPLGLVLPLVMLIPATIYLIGGGPAMRYFSRPSWGWLFFLLLASSWYIAATQIGEEEFLQRQVVFENLKRFLGGENVNARPIWYYVPAFLRIAAPWSLVFCLLVYVDFNRDALGGENSWERRRRRGLLVLFLAGFVFFSLAVGKRHSYLLPLYPALSIYLAQTGERYFATFSAETWRWFRQGTFWLTLALALVALGLASAITLLPAVGPFANVLFEELRLYLSNNALAAIPILLCSALVLLWAARPGDVLELNQPIVRLWFAVFTLLAVGHFVGWSVKNHLKGFAVIARSIEAVVPERSQIYLVREERDEFLDVVAYYLDRNAEMVLPDKVIDHCRGVYLSRKDFLAQVQVPNDRILVKVGEYRQFYDRIKGRDSRTMTLFQCQKRDQLKRREPGTIKGPRSLGATSI